MFTHDAVAAAGFGDSPWIYASYLIRARLKGDFSPTFISTFMTGPAGRKQLRERSKTSAGQYNINIEGIGSVTVPEVGIAEQMQFAARVEQVDAYRDAVQRVLAADNELFASLQARAFRGEL